MRLLLRSSSSKLPLRVRSNVASLAVTLFVNGCGLFPDLDHLTGAPAPIDACELVSEPRILYSRPPRSDALLGGVLAASENTVVAMAITEDPDWPAVPETFNPAGLCERTVRNVPGTGRLRIFEREGSEWFEQGFELAHSERLLPLVPKEVLPDAYSLARFPTTALAASDGLVAVGAASDSNGEGAFRGSVRLFRRDGAMYREDANPITEPSTLSGDIFGIRLALAGSALVVGAPGEDGAFPDSGAAYVYDVHETGFTRMGRLVPEAEQPGAWFGSSVAISDEWIVVGATREDVASLVTPLPSGAVYAFPRRGGPTQRLLPEDAVADQAFGTALAVRGDTLAVGSAATRGCAGVVNRELYGAVHLYALVSGKWTHRECLDANDERVLLFGWRVELARDALVVGAPFSRGLGRGENPVVVDSVDGSIYEGTGSVYVFPLSGANTRKPPCHLKALNADACDVFGETSAIASDFVAIGATGEDGPNNALRNAGAIYVYPLATP
jgi:hypothetical protein